MTPARPRAALAALAAVATITAAWWAFALWPVGTSAPDWVLRTRQVCFGATVDHLPNAGGWIVLIGQPAGMIALLFAAWGAELRAGIVALMSRVAGQIAAGLVLAVLTAGVGAVAMRVGSAGAESFDAGAGRSALTAVDDPAPALALTDQDGRTVTLDSKRGRPIMVTFAYAHCETMCPVIVSDVLAARRRIGNGAPELLIITLDPWRDTPSRLGSIAKSWGLTEGELVLSGPPDEVERALNAWRVPRTRNEKNGNISHPSMVYIVAPNGRIRYVLSAGVDEIVTALRAL